MNIAKYKDILSRFGGKGVYPHELAFLLDNPIRNLILSPGKLCDRLNLKENSVVLEIGPGPGFFSLEAAKRIPYGRLFLFDIQCEMLKKNRKKLSDAGMRNFCHTSGSAERLPFKKDHFDLIFMVTVLGEVERIPEALSSMKGVLKKGGILSLTEMKGDPDALSKEDILSMAKGCGFEFMEEFVSFAGFTLNLIKI